MRNGRISWTMNFFTRMNTELLFSAVTALRGGFIQEFLRTQQIIQRSMPLCTSMTVSDLLLFRVLIANIRNLGRCPCPRCLVRKDQIQNVATDIDMVQRQTFARRDTAERRNKIASARELIYEKGYVVDTAQVEAKLKDESLVPTVVS